MSSLQKIPYSELESFFRLKRIEPSPFDIDVLDALDDEFMESINNRKKD